MPKHDLYMKVFVFIARDEDEYEKYIMKKGENEEHGKNSEEKLNQHEGFKWRFDAKTKLLRLIINKGSLGENGWMYLRPAKTNEDFQDTCRLPVLLDQLRKNKNDSEDAEIAVEDVFVDASQDGNKMGGSLWGILQGLKDEDGQSIWADDINVYKVRIFIHWGGGELDNVLFYEQKVSEFLPKAWKLYSIGTNRNSLFNVDRGKIEIPCTLQDLLKLEKKFLGESDFVHVKDILTQYVVNNETWQKQTEHSDKDGCDYCMTDEVANDLRNYLEKCKENPLLVKKITNCITLQKLLQGGQTLPYCEKIEALFSLLIHEGIRHD